MPPPSSDQPIAPRRVLGDGEFTSILQPHVKGLLELARYAVDREAEPVNRPFLNSVHARTNRAVEVLDSCGARGNRKWFPFRVRLAALRNLAAASHEVLHVRQATPDYQLLEVEGDFIGDTGRAAQYFDSLIHCVLKRVLTEADAIGLPPAATGTIHPGHFAENLAPGRLVWDREGQHAQSPGERIVSLATKYLEVDAESRFLDAVLNGEGDWHGLIPEPLSEESIRGVMGSFHDLQSEYDTFVSDSEAEALDTDLLVLRGHASLALHLLQIGSTLTHFYERHMVGNIESLFCCQDCMLYEDTFQWVLFEYCLGYARRFSQAALPVAHRILRHYAETAEIEIPVPRYRGFHVRPSTYVSQIIRHYGSEATMVLADTEYNPGSAFELFRANEGIQKAKREQICEKVATEHANRPLPSGTDPETEIRRVLLGLAAERQIVIHEALTFDKLPLAPDRPLFELVADAVSYFLRTGRIDVQTDLTAIFRGDKRVLRDIQLLADADYGEDERGRNQPMPPELDYLKHTKVPQTQRDRDA